MEWLEEESTKAGTTEPSFARLLPQTSGSSSQADNLAMLSRDSNATARRLRTRGRDKSTWSDLVFYRGYIH